MPFRNYSLTKNGQLTIGSVRSPNFAHGVSGWRLGRDGSLEAHDVVIPEGSGGTVVTFGPVAPTAPHTGDVWYNTSAGLEASVCTSVSPVTWTPYQIGTGAIGNAAITPAQIASLTASLIGHAGGVLNANPFFWGGDLTGWAPGGTSTLGVTGSPPAGSPFPYAAVLTGLGGGANKLFDNGEAFPVQPNSQYLVTGFVYSPVPTVSFGMDWRTSAKALLSSGLQTIPVPVNTWTPISAVVTSPTTAGLALGNINLTPAAPGGTMYAAGLMALPQVPGALLQAGTVTAAQIKAGTITAALLAAGIVVAGIVDSTTINAATFNGSIFNGLDFTIDSAGIFFYSGTPASGNLVMALTNSSGNDPYGNAYNAGFSSLAANGARINIEPAGGVSALNMLAANMVHNVAAPQIVGGSVSPGLANEICQLAMSSGKETNIALPDSEIILSTGAADGSSNPNIALQFGGNPVLTADQVEVSVAVPVVADTWHTMTLAGGWTVGSGGRARYRLGIENRVFVDVSGIVPGTTTDGTVIWVPAVGYSPLAGASQVLTADVQYATAPAYGSGPSVKVGSGGILVENLRGTIASISFSGSYALD